MTSESQITTTREPEGTVSTLECDNGDESQENCGRVRRKRGFGEIINTGGWLISNKVVARDEEPESVPYLDAVPRVVHERR